MKNLPAYSHEIFFLYWRGHLQPCLRNLESVIEWIKHSEFVGCDIINFEVKSNYCSGYNIHELLEGNLKANVII